MEDTFLWHEQLTKFEQAYFSNGVNEQYDQFRQQALSHNSPSANNFRPLEAENLYAYINNVQYHLNGRNVLGLQRKWILERKNHYQTKHGCSINPGLIQFDHSNFMTHGNMNNIFIEAKNKEELLDIVKRLLNLSNEEMAREFNIMSSIHDISTLFNAIILDPIIDYEIERNNFEGYLHCWNDSHLISLSTKDKEEAYRIEEQYRPENPYGNNELGSPIIITLPNGESITFKQKFNSKENEYSYTIDDISTEILEIKGNSELIQRLVAQIERFSERKLEPQETSIENELIDSEEKNVEQQENTIEDELIDSTYTSENSEQLLTKQILVKKLQLVIDDFKNGNSTVQSISIEEFELLYPMLYLSSIDRNSIAYISSDNTITVPSLDSPIPSRQYTIIQLPDGKQICAEFLAHENKGTIKIKDFDRMTEPEGNIDFIYIKKAVDAQEVKDSLKTYRTDESLRQLLERKLHLQEVELSSLEDKEEIISEAEALVNKTRKKGQNIGEE